MVIKVAGKEILQRKLYVEQKLFNLDKLCNLIISILLDFQVLCTEFNQLRV